MSDADFLAECVDHNTETGIAVWRTRPAKHFKDSKQRDEWNTKLAGKVIGFLFVRDGVVYRQLVRGNARFKPHRMVWIHPPVSEART